MLLDLSENVSLSLSRSESGTDSLQVRIIHTKKNTYLCVSSPYQKTRMTGWKPAWGEERVQP